MTKTDVNRLALLSPAKVNLFFRVLRRREDGFHEIASLYQAVDLFDELTISLSDRDALTCTDPLVPTDANNLLFKALAAFRRHTDWKGSVRMHLKKRIPIQSGLGGGSGNAATLLWGLNKLLSYAIPDAVLSEWAAEFSSDASFFFSQGTAYCTGRGEKREDLAPLPSQEIFIVKPPYGLSTPAVYDKCIVGELASRDPLFFLQKAYAGEKALFNDLEPAAFALMPELASLKQELLNLGLQSVCMTGSGSALMGFASNHFQFIHSFSERGIVCYSVRFINRTPDCWYGFSK